MSSEHVLEYPFDNPLIHLCDACLDTTSAEIIKDSIRNNHQLYCIHTWASKFPEKKMSKLPHFHKRTETLDFDSSSNFCRDNK